MSEPAEILIDLVRNASRDEIVSYVKQQDNKTKKQLFAAVQIEFRLAHNLYSNEKHEVPYSLKACKNSPEERCRLIGIVIFGCCSFTEIKQIDWPMIPEGEDLEFAVTLFAPVWIDDWAEYILSRHTFRFWDIRSLVIKCLCEKPTDTTYTLAFINSGYRIRRNSSTTTNSAVEQADLITGLPDIIEDLAWRLFEIEGGGDVSLSAVDKYSGHGIWNQTLVELSDRGVLSRQRLLDESLEALARGFAQFRANWFSQFHNTLHPNLDEREARSEHYLQLLASNSANTVSFAIKSLKILDADNRLDPQAVIASVRPAMHAKAKSTIKSALKLVENSVNRSPELISDALPIVTDSLIHESADVQKIALLMLKRHQAQLTKEMIDQLELYSDSIAPSLRTDFELLTGMVAMTVSGEEVSVKAVETVPLKPVSDFSSCLLLYLEILENSANPAEIEMLLDGLCRLSSQRSSRDDELIDALKKRASTISNVESRLLDFDGAYDLVRIHLARLAVSLAELWMTTDQSIRNKLVLTSISGRQDRGIPRFDELFHDRNEWVFSIVREKLDLPLLSTPTDSRYCIEGRSLLHRLAQYSERKISLDECDLTLAMMRLDPADRTEIYPHLKKTKFTKKLIKDIDSPPTKYNLDIGPESGSYQCAKPQNGLLAKKYQNYPVDLFRIVDEWNSLYTLFAGPVNTNRWYATVWPTNPEAFFANALNAYDSGQNLSNSPYQAFFEPMLNEGFSPGECGTVLLLMGLVGHDPSIRTLAIDAFIPAAQRGSLDIITMGIAASKLFPNSTPLARYTNTLKEIVSVQPSLAPLVRSLIAETLRYDPVSPPRGLAGLLDLLFELCLQDNVVMEHAEANSFLTKLKPTSSSGKSAGKILSLLDKCA